MAAKFIPQTLKDFGYTFNKLGQLRQIDPETGKPTDIPFKFNVFSSQMENQNRYDALGEAITSHVYDLLEKRAELVKILIPREEQQQQEARSFVYATPDWQQNDKLLLLIHGNGAVRAGQWARSLIINDSLDSGSQLPYIERGKELGWAVMVANTNLNHAEDKLIDGSRSPEEHLLTLWKQCIKGNTDDGLLRQVAIVAHSYGGVATLNLATEEEEAFCKQVVALAFTDSVHGMVYSTFSSRLTHHLKQIGRHWVAASSPLDTVINESENCLINEVSAGSDEHTTTSWSSFHSVFKFIEDKFKSLNMHSAL